LSTKANGLDNIHEKNLEEYLNKEVKVEKEVRKEQKKAKATMKWRED
jgi:hypothetical protein